ncbi:MAG: class I SAM-dependent methyltransferase [Defluviitaleaceae bacterium]|nr:class I SAM-dependent methyltransferase [Defluviitaleaceae bacterium]
MQELSKRLQAIAGMVAYKTLVDVGCDHALLPIHLLQTGVISKVIATDISAPSLEKGRQNAIALGLGNQLSFTLSDGLKNVDCDGIDICVIAGMGGGTIISILDGVPLDFKQIILSPQRDVADVRRFVHQKGFDIVNEMLLIENRKFYNIMDARPSPSSRHCGLDLQSPPFGYDEAGYLFGQILIDKKCPTLGEYIKIEIRKTKKTLEGNLPQSRQEELLQYMQVCLSLV